MPHRKLVVEFTKMSGAGNDFIVLDNRFYHFDKRELAALALHWCPRRTGVGADGLLAMAVPDDETHAFQMRYLNADGATAMCGNGARCMARFARHAGIDRDEMSFETDAGVLRATVPADTHASVRLCLPAFSNFMPGKVEVGAKSVFDGRANYIWTGTHHVVCFVDKVLAIPVEKWGGAIRHNDALKPCGSNVNFVEVIDGASSGRAQLRVRTFEKGVEAETLACGTGAMASALVARLLGHISANKVDVEMLGGILTVGWDGPDYAGLFLEGPAETIYRGSFEVDV